MREALLRETGSDNPGPVIAEAVFRNNEEVRLIVAKEFRWIPNGPIQRFFRREVQPAFMQSPFSGPGEKLLFQSGMLSRGSNAAIMRRMERLLAEFNELHEEDAGLPLAERYGTSLLVALRPWEFGYFSKLRRRPDEKRF